MVFGRPEHTGASLSIRSSTKARELLPYRQPRSLRMKQFKNVSSDMVRMSEWPNPLQCIKQVDQGNGKLDPDPGGTGGITPTLD